MRNYCSGKQKEVFLRQTKKQFVLACILRYFSFVLMSLILSACVTTRQCLIETLQPAKVVIPIQNQRIAICASPNLFSDIFIVDNDQSVYIPSNVPVDSLTLNILYSLQKYWKEAPDFKDAAFSVFALKNDTFPALSNFDLVVRLEKLHVKNTYYSWPLNYMEWEVRLHVLYNAEWSIRDKSGQVLDKYPDHDLLVWSSGPQSGPFTPEAGLPKIEDAWWDMGIAIGHNYAERITPHWETEARYIYMINKYPDLSQQAYAAIQNDSYARAFSIWEDMLMRCHKKRQRKKKGQITYNMAVACEYQNQIAQAIQWVQQSINYSKNSANSEYINHLQKREMQSLQLDQQINQ